MWRPEEKADIPAYNDEMGPQTYRHTKQDSANDVNELGSGFLPRASR